MSASAKLAGDGRQAVWTREKIISALQEYAQRYGDDFAAAAFSPAAAKRGGRPDLVERYYAGRLNGSPWPSLNVIKQYNDESFTKARVNAGFAPNSTGPARGRRAPGQAQPILMVRERLRFVPDERLAAARREITLLRDRVTRERARRHRAEESLRAATAQRESQDGREAGSMIGSRQKRRELERARTKVKTVKVRDERAIERLRVKLEDERARARALTDQLRAAVRDRDGLAVELQKVRAWAQERDQEAAQAGREAHAAHDRLVAAQARAQRLSDELEKIGERLLGVEQAAVSADLVRRAERRADEAEQRAAKAQRMMVEQASAITGEMRQLTSDEIAELRGRGPAGELMLSAAIKAFARARAKGGREPQRAALRDLARAAWTWADRL